MGGDKWASPSLQPREASRHARDLLVADMESSAKPPPLRSSAEDDDTVLVDHEDQEMMDVDSEPVQPLGAGDPRMRASQVGALLEDDEEEIEEKIEEEEEEEKDEKEDQPIYFQSEDTTKGFEVDTAKTGAADKAPPEFAPKEEEEEFEDASLKDLSEIAVKDEDEDEELRRMYEKYDFIKSNFDNLNATPAAQNPMRLSISRKFLEQPGQQREPKLSTGSANSSGNTSAEETASKPKKIKEPLSKEVEKTRERLAKMGIVLPSAQAGKTLEAQVSPTTATTTTTTTTTASPPSPTLLPTPKGQISPTSVRPPTSTSPQHSLTPPGTAVPSTMPLPPSTAESQPTIPLGESAQFGGSQFGTTLRRPLAEYESAMGSLAESMQKTLQLWKEVRESSTSDPTANYLSGQFQSLFSSITGQIVEADPSLTQTFTNVSQSQSVPSSADPLERYSDLLIERVVQKLGSADVQNRFLQSLTSSFKSSGTFN